MNTKENEKVCLPNPLLSIIPLVFLICSVALSIKLFGSDAMNGSNEIALLMSSGVCVALSMFVYGVRWKQFEQYISNTIKDSSISIIILLIIGMLSGAWMISGTVPTLVYYGVQIMSPRYFLVTTCMLCAIVSLVTGSSWTTVATMGVALVGIGQAIGVSAAWTAGAIISGSYFGDKVSPLSDTTILASTVSGTELFTHIRYMMYTTVPSLIVTLIIFFFVGMGFDGGDSTLVNQYVSYIGTKFNISLLTLIVPVITGVMIARRIPSVITLFLSALLAGVMAVFLQPDILREIASNDGAGILQLTKGFLMMFFASTSVDTGNAAINDLVSTGGMSGMMNTVWLILCAMCFGGVMMASRMLESIVLVILRRVRSAFGLVSSTVSTGILMNLTTSDQYISIILTANMYRDTYEKEGYENRLLSRSAEDSATVTSVLIPWNTCGMAQATVLGIPTLVYMPFCFFNYISPLMSMLVAAFGWKIFRRDLGEVEDGLKPCVECVKSDDD